MPNYVLDCVRGPNKSFWKGQLRLLLSYIVKNIPNQYRLWWARMHMYAMSAVAKMHKIQFIRRKENIFTLEEDASISDSKTFFTVVD